ncbi:Tuberculostearic acid methyltransferase [Actinidia chinensis var. chinensis]|uniref:Tuberculostearic acid methyltransferase n=1 Tax=Actinidia chinensis var. chinensis TaxID=1590841 RepID=A0A2R6S051_ACTCC|nr:Tuberculostearic acid methyltransferase [Actinidia chinensis var. chinensis]
MSKMRAAVVGGGISGLVAASVLVKGGAEVVVYEKEEYLGGHARTVTFDGIDLDLGFMVFNRVTYPNMMEFFESLGVDMEVSDMSFSVSLDKGQGCEWGSRNGLSGLFAQKKNAFNPYFWQMIREIVKFKDDVLRYLEDLENNPDIDRNETLGHFVKSRGYSDLFQKAYLIPICASIWSCPSEGVMNFSAYFVLSFCRNHHLLQLFGRPQWLTVKWRSQNYVNKVREQLESKGCQIRSGCGVLSVSTIDGGCLVTCEDGSQETYDGCIMAVHAPDALKMLGKQATYDEMRVLGAFQYVYSDIFLHRDKNLMPRNPASWSAWNFLGTMDNKVCVTYWLNVLQNIDETALPYLVTLNPPHTPEHTLLKWSTGHPLPSVAASKASIELDHIQGKRGIWFCGAYQGYGFHEDGLKAGLVAAHGMLRKSWTVLNNPKHMVPSLIETGARLFVTRFLGHYVSTGCLTILEEGGTMFNFEGTRKNCLLKVSLKVHNPQFYWKVVTQADLGLADAYINGDFSLVDKNEGLQNLFMILIANRDLNNSSSKKRGWWTPLLFTACIASAKYFFQHVSRQNTLTQARRNISRHYDLSNELFALFLDETMTYSCAVFKSEDEDLKVAQLRKITLLIEKARIRKEHEILEIGCGWGSLAIEVVKRTGCKYTGITLSEEQLRFAEMKVKEAGLQDDIRFLLCDYRQLPNTYKYDRIISCEMIEAVGHEYMEEFFGGCDSVLAEDGLLVLQFISIPDERYDEYRRSSDFIKEYIFPGGCLPSLSRITSAMVASSRLCVEHLENIGIHYYQTLRCWRKNFLEQQR